MSTQTNSITKASLPCRSHTHTHTHTNHLMGDLLQSELSNLTFHIPALGQISAGWEARYQKSLHSLPVQWSSWMRLTVADKAGILQLPIYHPKSVNSAFRRLIHKMHCIIEVCFFLPFTFYGCLSASIYSPSRILQSKQSNKLKDFPQLQLRVAIFSDYHNISAEKSWNFCILCYWF